MEREEWQCTKERKDGQEGQEKDGQEGQENLLLLLSPWKCQHAIVLGICKIPEERAGIWTLYVGIEAAKENKSP